MTNHLRIIMDSHTIIRMLKNIRILLCLQPVRNEFLYQNG